MLFLRELYCYFPQALVSSNTRVAIPPFLLLHGIHYIFCKMIMLLTVRVIVFHCCNCPPCINGSRRCCSPRPTNRAKGRPETAGKAAYILPTQFSTNYKEGPLLRKGLPCRFRTITQLTVAEQAPPRRLPPITSECVWSGRFNSS